MATIADLTPTVVKLLGNRTDVAALVPENMGNVIRELSDDYPFEQLRVTGPTVQFTPGQGAYPSSFFEKVQGANPFPYVFNKMVSWWFYLQPPVAFTGGSQVGAANPGYRLKFKSITDMEVLINTLTLPMYWSQNGAQGDPVAEASDDTFFIAGVPNIAYFTYARYQFLHPFSDPIALSTDNIYLPSTWYDIIEYATAERVALMLRMQDVADRYHNKIFGDPKAREGSGSALGLIRQRVSQIQKNQGTTTRSIQVMRGRY